MFNITKETWGKCGIKTVKYYNKNIYIYIIELWNKMSDIEIQLRHSNIYDIALKRIESIVGKNKRHSRKRKTKL